MANNIDRKTGARGRAKVSHCPIVSNDPQVVLKSSPSYPQAVSKLLEELLQCSGILQAVQYSNDPQMHQFCFILYFLPSKNLNLKEQ